MVYLSAAVAVVGTVAALNLLLLLGVLRRLREQAERLAALAASGGFGPPVELMLPVGGRPAEFRAETVDGVEVSLASLAAPALLGFFSPRCEPCREWVPRFVKAAGELPHGRSQALAVVVGDGAEASDEVAQLRRVAQVVVEPPDGPVSRAFAVTGWPVLCRLDEDGTITATENQAAVAAPAAA